MMPSFATFAMLLRRILLLLPQTHHCIQNFLKRLWWSRADAPMAALTAILQVMNISSANTIHMEN
jgi:hypothetical protein